MAARKPFKPPDFTKLLQKKGEPGNLARITQLAADPSLARDYWHWDALRHRTPPDGLDHEGWWLGIKLQRQGQLRPVPLLDKEGKPFRFLIPDSALEQLHSMDRDVDGLPAPITRPPTRDQYLVRSLIEEAITSSQLEGAVTTREVAKEMIRSGRPPRDRSEQMILNNYLTMQHITEIKGRNLTPGLVFDLHRLVTEKTLDDPSAAGCLRRGDEKCVLADWEGEVYHEPPPAEQLESRLRAMCEFANGQTPDFFIHPVVRAIILHFWLAYDHPFVDGNGRTARALFYWAMLHHDFWLFEFVSISSILLKAPAQYARSFLYTETDDNDLTYFVLEQMRVIRRATDELHGYVERKTSEVRELESQLGALRTFNRRQVELIRHALKHPSQEYTIESHRKSHSVVYETARTDLLQLHALKLLGVSKRGKAMVFTAPADLAERLKKLEKKGRP